MNVKSTPISLIGQPADKPPVLLFGDGPKHKPLGNALRTQNGWSIQLRTCDGWRGDVEPCEAAVFMVEGSAAQVAYELKGYPCHVMSPADVAHFNPATGLVELPDGEGEPDGVNDGGPAGGVTLTEAMMAQMEADDPLLVAADRHQNAIPADRNPALTFSQDEVDDAERRIAEVAAAAEAEGKGEAPGGDGADGRTIVDLTGGGAGGFTPGTHEEQGTRSDGTVAHERQGTAPMAGAKKAARNKPLRAK